MSLLSMLIFLAQQKKDDSSGVVCLVVGGFVVVGFLASAMDKPVRCKRCGYRAKKSKFRGGCCPNCDSYEI